MRLDHNDRHARIEAEARRMRARFLHDLFSRMFRRSPHAGVSGARAA